MSQLSKKDLSFEKERAKYRKKIRELESVIKIQDEQIATLEKISDKKGEQIQIQSEWIERLLKYTEITKEDLQKIINKDKEMAKLTGELVYVAKILDMARA